MRKTKTTSAGLMTIPAGRVVQRLWGTNKHDGTPWEFFNVRSYASSQAKFGRTSSISYETGNGGSYRPCTHKIIDYGTPSLMSGPYQYAAVTQFGVTTNYDCTGLMGYVHTVFPDIGAFSGASDPRVLSDLPWDELSAQAWDAMRPSMTADNSILNFLYELKDFKRLANSIWARLNNRVGTDEVLRQAFGGVSKLSKRNSKAPLKDIAKSYLQYKFAWAPFISDIVSMYNALRNLEKRLSDLKKRAGKPQSRRYSTLVPGTTIPEIVLYQDYVGMPGGSVGDFSPRAKIRVVRHASEGVYYHANMRYSYQLPPEVNGIHGQIKAYMDALGFRLNPAIVWNALPFTFLVDWFFNVGEVLGRFSVDNLQIKVGISEFCQSAKSTLSISAYASLNWQQQYTERWYGEFPFRSYSASLYHRSVGLPSLRGSLNMQDPNAINLATASALVVSRR